MKIHYYIFFHVCLALAALAANPLKGEDQMKKAESVGIPIKSIVYGNSHAVLAKSPKGQSNMFYISYYSTTGSELVGYHSASGEFVSIKLGSNGGYGCCLGTDGAIYIGGINPGNLYRYDPAAGKVENLGGSQFGVTYIWDTAASPDGKIYGACYPTCSVIEYDITSKTLKDLGRVNDKEQYARSICVDHRGKVWVGTGNRAHLVVLDPKTGERRDVLPPEYADNSTCYDLGVSGKYVLCSILYDGKMLVFDAETEKIVRVIPRPQDSTLWMNAHGTVAGEAFLYSSPNGDLYRYNIEEDKLILLAPMLGQCEWVVGQHVYGINDQDYFLYDLKKKKYLNRRKLTKAKDGMNIQTLTGHPNGRIYGSTFINQHIFSYNPATGSLTDLGKVIRGGGQVDSIHSGRDGKIYLGCYARAYLAVYDPARPWQPGREKESNPRELGTIGHGQYRTHAIALGPDGNIWVGSIPSYNSAPTGAFSRWNPKTGEHKSWTDLVPGGAVDRIAVDEKYLYCAGGGLFFVWDPKAEKKVYEEKRKVSSLVVMPNGGILGNSGEEMFVFDPKEMKIEKTFPSPIGQMDAMTVAPDGKAYGINGKAMAEIDPSAWTGKKIADEGGSFLATDRDGILYFARGADLFRLK